MPLNKRLITAQAKLDKAEAAFDAVLKDVQKKCDHGIVHARPAGRPFQYLDTYWQEARVCKSCGLYEESDWGRFKKLKTENVVTMDFDFNIYSHRLQPRDHQ
jgi:hypothetical protein